MKKLIERDCSFDGCDREGVSRWRGQTDILCYTHYEQMTLTGTLKPIRPTRRLHRDENGRVCTSCDQYKPWNEYYANKAQCKPCHIKMVQRRKAERDAELQ